MLTIAELLTKFPTHYEARNFSTVFTRPANGPVGVSCVRKDNHLLRCCIDIYCSRTLYTGELVELKLAGR
jgi:hypothetical protein